MATIKKEQNPKKSKIDSLILATEACHIHYAY